MNISMRKLNLGYGLFESYLSILRVNLEITCQQKRALFHKKNAIYIHYAILYTKKMPDMGYSIFIYSVR